MSTNIKMAPLLSSLEKEQTAKIFKRQPETEYIFGKTVPKINVNNFVTKLQRKLANFSRQSFCTRDFNLSQQELK